MLIRRRHATEPMQTVKKSLTLMLTFDLVISGLVHAEVLLWTTGPLSLVSIVPAIFLLDCRQTDKQTNRQTDAIKCSIPHCRLYSRRGDTQPARDNNKEKVHLSATSGMMKCWPERWSTKSINITLVNLYRTSCYWNKNKAAARRLKKRCHFEGTGIHLS